MKILHRDMKSANIFLYKDSTAKLGDLNVSKVAKKGLLYTQTGTPYYASPEVWKDQPYDLKSDIWSLGCVLYEMCALVPPFRADDMNGLFKRVLKGSYPPIPSHYSMDMRQLIKTLLQVQAQSRPTCDQILDMTIVQKRIKKYFSNRDGSPSTHFDSQAETGLTESELLKTIKLQANVFKMALPSAQYLEKNNYATIPGSQVIKNERPSLQERAKLNKTNKNQPNEQLEVLPTVKNKGKRLAQIDDDNYEEDFDDENGRKKTDPVEEKDKEKPEVGKTKITAVKEREKDSKLGESAAKNAIPGGVKRERNNPSTKSKEKLLDENNEVYANAPQKPKAGAMSITDDSRAESKRIATQPDSRSGKPEGKDPYADDNITVSSKKDNKEQQKLLA